MKTFNEYALHEGLYDPGIFHAFFLAGGPASGKSAASFKVTGSRSNSFTRKQNERLVNVNVGRTGPMGLKVINSDEILEKLITDAGMHTEMDKYSPDELTQRENLRNLKLIDNMREKVCSIINDKNRNPEDVWAKKRLDFPDLCKKNEMTCYNKYLNDWSHLDDKSKIYSISSFFTFNLNPELKSGSCSFIDNPTFNPLL